MGKPGCDICKSILTKVQSWRVEWRRRFGKCILEISQRAYDAGKATFLNKNILQLQEDLTQDTEFLSVGLEEALETYNKKCGTPLTSEEEACRHTCRGHYGRR